MATNARAGGVASSIVRLTKRTGSVRGVRPEDGPPVVELELAPGERVVSFYLMDDRYGASRTGVDWSWTAYVERDA